VTLGCVGLVLWAALGWLTVRLLAPGLFRSVQLRVVAGVVGLGLGLGAASWSLFLTGLLFDSIGGIPVLVELAALSAGLLWLRGKVAVAEAGPEPRDKRSPPLSALSWGLLGVLLAAALVDVLWLARETAAQPHGSWDAWAIWNVRARFFFRADHDWTNAFLTSRGHPDYPLLLPLTVARLWSCVGSETTLVPRAVSLAFLGGTLTLAVLSLAALRGWTQGLVAGLVLLGTPQLIGHAPAQDAETPLAFWLLAACALLVLRDREGTSRSGLLVLAGAAASMAAWTKNEGVLQLIALGGAVSLCAVRSTPREQGLREICWFLLGALPATALVTAFKLGWAPPGDLLAGQGLEETSARLLDGSRYATVAQRMLLEFLQVGRGYVWLLLIWVLALGWRRPGRGTAAALIALVATAIGYFFVYVTTPHELDWHLATSCRRILTTLWPSLVLVFFAGTASVEEALRRRARS
jgi:hypothetical protein